MDDIRIVILQRGYIFVARVPDPTAHVFWLPWSRRRTIRRWGTTQGLGQLCDGPTSETQLDNLVGEGCSPLGSIVEILTVSPQGQKAWAKFLDGSKK